MNRNKKTRRHMSDDLKWVITFLLVIAAVSMVIVCAKNGVFHFEAGTVTANDDETVMESAAPEESEDTDDNSSSKFNVFVTAGNGGTANPAGSISVEAYDSITVSFTPDEGYVVESVTLDGQELGAVESYTLSYIDKNHNIVVTFAEEEIEPEEEEETDVGENDASGNDGDLTNIITDGVNGIFDMILGE